jgi:hypothetical protein
MAAVQVIGSRYVESMSTISQNKKVSFNKNKFSFRTTATIPSLTEFELTQLGSRKEVDD